MSNRDTKGIVRGNKAGIGKLDEYFASVSPQRSWSRMPSSCLEGEPFLKPRCASSELSPGLRTKKCSRLSKSTGWRCWPKAPRETELPWDEWWGLPMGRWWTNERNLAALAFVQHLLGNRPSRRWSLCCAPQFAALHLPASSELNHWDSAFQLRLFWNSLSFASLAMSSLQVVVNPAALGVFTAHEDDTKLALHNLLANGASYDSVVVES